MIFLWRYAGQPEANVEAAKKVLEDLPVDELGQKAVAWAYNNGITKYYVSEGLFAPEVKITRREAMIFLWRYAGQPVTGSDVFDDLPEGVEDKMAIVWAYNHGVTKYYSVEGEFAPNVVATRREAKVFITRAFR